MTEEKIGILGLDTKSSEDLGSTYASITLILGVIYTIALLTDGIIITSKILTFPVIFFSLMFYILGREDENESLKKSGLAIISAFLTTAGLAALIKNFWINPWFLLPAFLVIGEVYFYFDKAEPSRDDDLDEFTQKRKVAAWVKSFIATPTLAGLVNIAASINYPTTRQLIGTSKSTGIWLLKALGLLFILAIAGSLAYYIWKFIVWFNKKKFTRGEDDEK